MIPINGLTRADNLVVNSCVLWGFFGGRGLVFFLKSVKMFSHQVSFNVRNQDMFSGIFK